MHAPTSLSTTARKGKKRQAKCVVGAHVSIPRKLLKTHIDFDSEAFKSIEGLSDDLLLYGSVTGSKLRGSFTVEFDRLPLNEAVVVPRAHITTVDKNAEEPEYGHANAVEAITTINGSNENEWEDASEDELVNNGHARKTARKKNPWMESQEKFISLPDDVRASSKSFEHFYGTKPEEKIVWKILSDNEQIMQDAMDLQIDEIYNPVKVDIPWSPVLRDVNYNSIFFEHFFPSLEGKAKLMDEYLWDRRCSMYATVIKDKIKFHDPEQDNPDSLVRLCVIFMIVGALEVHNGIENLWKNGNVYGMKKYPNYGQYLPVNYFHAFVCAFPYVWGDKVYWFKPKNNIPWNMFLPFVQAYNEMRTLLMDVRYAVLDESMLGWRPKTSATGGLPNITFEPQKPKNLGTMIRNSAECITGMIIHHECKAQQSRQERNMLMKSRPCQKVRKFRCMLRRCFDKQNVLRFPRADGLAGMPGLVL